MKKLTILTFLTLANLILVIASLDASSPKPSTPASLTLQARVICGEKGILLDDKSCDGIYTPHELEIVKTARNSVRIMEEGDRHSAILANPASSRAEKDVARLRLIELNSLLKTEKAKLSRL